MGARRAIAVILMLVAGAICPGRAEAGTTEGTLLTNIATATYSTMQNLEFSVSYNSTARVLVAFPSVQLQKTVSPTFDCPGATVTFCVYAVNTSTLTSAFDVVIKDTFTDTMAYVAGQNNWAGNTTGAAIVAYRSIATAFGPWFEQFDFVNGEPPDGQAYPYYLRWAINIIGPGKSALVCFKMRIL